MRASGRRSRSSVPRPGARRALRAECSSLWVVGPGAPRAQEVGLCWAGSDLKGSPQVPCKEAGISFS